MVHRLEVKGENEHFLGPFYARFQADYLIEVGIILSHMKTKRFTWFSVMPVWSHLTDEISKVQTNLCLGQGHTVIILVTMI